MAVTVKSKPLFCASTAFPVTLKTIASPSFRGIPIITKLLLAKTSPTRPRSQPVTSAAASKSKRTTSTPTMPTAAQFAIGLVNRPKFVFVKSSTSTALASRLEFCFHPKMSPARSMLTTMLTSCSSCRSSTSNSSSSNNSSISSSINSSSKRSNSKSGSSNNSSSNNSSVDCCSSKSTKSKRDAFLFLQRSLFSNSGSRSMSETLAVGLLPGLSDFHHGVVFKRFYSRRYRRDNVSHESYTYREEVRLGNDVTGDCDRLSTDELVQRVVENTRKVDIMVDCLSQNDIFHLINDLLVQGFHSVELEKLLSGRLWLLQNPQATREITQLLLIYDFPHSLICRIVGSVPYHLQHNLNDLPSMMTDMISFFGRQGFADDSLMSVISKGPSLLYLNLKSVEKSLLNLKVYFSSRDLKKLLRKCPESLKDPWTDVYRKYRYVIYDMVFTNQDIVHSSLFSHSLQRIKNRHLFLERSGLFVTVSPKHDPALNPNPQLSQIVDTSDAAFLKLFPVTDMEGYQVFCLMREIEADRDGDLEEITSEDEEEKEE